MKKKKKKNQVITSQMPKQPSRNLSVNKSICLYVGATQSSMNLKRNIEANEPSKELECK